MCRHSEQREESRVDIINKNRQQQFVSTCHIQHTIL